jgi:hypothetical protein
VKPTDLTPRAIDQNVDFVTLHELPTAPPAYALRMKGIRSSRPGIIFERDPGTRHRFDTYPQTPNPEGLPIEMAKGTTLYDPVTGSEHEVVVGLDVALGSHIYVSEPGWPELTRQVVATVNGAPSEKTIELIYVADYLGQPLALPDLGNWIAENKAKGTCALVLATGPSSVDLDIMVDGTGLGWEDGDEITFHATDATLHGWKFDNGDTPHVRWLEVEARRKVYLLTGDSNIPITPNYAFVIEKREERGYFFRNTDTPWGPDIGYTEGQKVNTGTPSITYLCTCDHTSATENEPGTGEHWEDYWSVSTPTDIALATLPPGWYAELAGGLIPNFERMGSEGSPLDAAAAASGSVIFDDPEGNPFLQISISTSTALSSYGETRAHAKVAVTVLYDDYMQSDPILRAYITNSSLTNVAAYLNPLKFNLSHARMPKNVSGFRVYVALRSIADTPNFVDWVELDEEYFLTQEVLINEQTTLGSLGRPYCVNWSLDDTTERGYAIEVLVPVSISASAVPTTNLLEELGHGVATTRSRIKPRFAAHVTREQGAVIAMDDSDTSLRLTSFNGEQNIHEDGNFVNQTTDRDGNALIIPVTGHGDLMGLGFANDAIAVVHRGEIELRDFQSGELRRFVAVDVASKESVSDKGFGLTWAGHSGIWLLPNDGSGERIINPLWLNFYDGRMKTLDGVTPYVSQAQREKIVTGWHPAYREYVYLLEVLTDDGASAEYWGMRYNGRTWSIKEMFPKGIT